MYLGWRRAAGRRTTVVALQEFDTIRIALVYRFHTLQRSTGSQLCHQPLQHRCGAGPNRWVGRCAGSYQVHDALHSTRGMCFSSCCTGRHLQAARTLQRAVCCHPRPPVDTRAERWASARSSAAARAPRSQPRSARCPGNTHRPQGSTALQAAPLAQHACGRSPRRSLLRRSPATAPSPGRPHSPADPPTASRCCVYNSSNCKHSAIQADTAPCHQERRINPALPSPALQVAVHHWKGVQVGHSLCDINSSLPSPAHNTGLRISLTQKVAWSRARPTCHHPQSGSRTHLACHCSRCRTFTSLRASKSDPPFIYPVASTSS